MKKLFSSILSVLALALAACGGSSPPVEGVRGAAQDGLETAQEGIETAQDAVADAQEAVTDAIDDAMRACDLDAIERADGYDANLHLINNTGETLSFSWLDASLDPPALSDRGQIADGETFKQETFAGHLFVANNGAGVPIFEYVVTEDDKQCVVIESTTPITLTVVESVEKPVEELVEEVAEETPDDAPASETAFDINNYIYLDGAVLNSFNYPENYLVASESGTAVELMPVSADSAVELQKRSEFTIYGTDGSGQVVLLQVTNPAGAFVVATPGGVTLSMLDGSDGYTANDATFFAERGLAGEGLSFESTTNPNYFLRHRGFVLHLEARTDDQLYLEDATFLRWPLNDPNAETGGTTDSEEAAAPTYPTAATVEAGRLPALANHQPIMSI